MSHVMQQNTKKIDMSQVVKMAKQKSIDIFLTDTAMITAFALVITFTGLMFMKNTLTQSNSEKSVAWYVAILKRLRRQILNVVKIVVIQNYNLPPIVLMRCMLLKLVLNNNLL